MYLNKGLLGSSFRTDTKPFLLCFMLWIRFEYKSTFLCWTVFRMIISTIMILAFFWRSSYGFSACLVEWNVYFYERIWMWNFRQFFFFFWIFTEHLRGFSLISIEAFNHHFLWNIMLENLILLWFICKTLKGRSDIS